MSAPARRRPQRLDTRHREVPLTELARILAGDTIDPAGRCQAFHLFPDGTAILVDHTGHTHRLAPSADGLYHLTPLGLPGPTQTQACSQKLAIRS